MSNASHLQIKLPYFEGKQTHLYTQPYILWYHVWILYKVMTYKGERWSTSEWNFFCQLSIIEILSIYQKYDHLGLLKVPTAMSCVLPKKWKTTASFFSASYFTMDTEKDPFRAERYQRIIMIDSCQQHIFLNKHEVGRWNLHQQSLYR